MTAPADSASAAFTSAAAAAPSSPRPAVGPLLAHALHGRRVVELATGIAGAQCGHALAGLGATVTTVRAPASVPGHLDGGKTVLTLDAATPDGFAALVAACAGCDLLIEERPARGWPDAGPLHARLLARLPHLLVVCLTPWGLHGPRANDPGYPLNVYHGGGNAQQIPCDLLRPDDRTREPLQAGGHWGEAQAGTQAALVALACLLDPPRYAGMVLDCAKQEALISYNWTETARFPNEGRSPSRLAPLATIVGGILPARDGHVQVAVREDHQWAALATLLGHPEWITDARWATRAARTAAAAAVSQLLAAETVRHAKRDLHRRGRDLGVPIAAVLAPAELLADADLAARGAWEEDAVTGTRRPRWANHVSGRGGPAGTDAGHGALQPNNLQQDDVRQSCLRPDAPPSGLVPGNDTAVTRPAGAGCMDSTTPGARNRPLAGIRVLDFGWVAMGPYAGYVLAALGAEVIHVGRPPDAHGGGVDLGHYNYGFDTLNTGKTWVGIDLKHPDGLALVRQLVAHCDVVLDNFRPGVMQRLGLDPAALGVLNPRLLSLSATTYGHQDTGGPWIGYAPVFAALAGLAHCTGYADGPPAEVSHPVDFYAGSVGIMGVLAGLHRRAVTGTGCHIDLAAREAVLWSLAHDLVAVQRGTWPATRLGNADPDRAPHGAYRCAGHNQWLSIAVGSRAEWLSLCACLGAFDLAADDTLAEAAGRVARRAEIDARITAWTTQQARDDASAVLRAAGVAACASATSEDLWRDAHLQARGVFQAHDDRGTTRWYVTAPWHYQGEARVQLTTRQGRAALDAVLNGVLGVPAAQIEALLASGAIAAR